uniref:tetrahydrofolate synthase n=1 Tax=candidate division WOR-3 bacterium TaxID=2052148 RepID=A0A7C4GDA3_UNCW3
MTYRAALQFLDSLVDYEKSAKPRDEFKLDNMRRLLDLAGNPQKRLRRTVLVAGTKGKGSSCYMLEAALRACGLSTGLFVSPHVLDVRERIQLDGQPVLPQLFSRLVERFRPLVRRQPVSYFELTAAMAFDLFARRDVDYAVVEVGLGGRLDATNLSEPDISVITRIGLDHIQVLGGTVRKIAREKAGIMRAGRPVVVARQQPDAADELAKCARRVGAELVSVAARSRTWDEVAGTDGISFSAFTDLGAGRFELPLFGRHQIDNCLTALTVLGRLAQLDSRVQLEPARQGLARVSIPARCMIAARRPLTVVDSCHNPDSGEALAAVIGEHLKSKVVLVYGSLRGKLVKKTIQPLVPWTELAIVTAPHSPRAMAPDELVRVFRRLGVRVETAVDVGAALTAARVAAGTRLPVVVAGSFYLAGEALAVLRRLTRS